MYFLSRTTRSRKKMWIVCRGKCTGYFVGGGGKSKAKRGYSYYCWVADARKSQVERLRDTETKDDYDIATLEEMEIVLTTKHSIQKTWVKYFWLMFMKTSSVLWCTTAKHGKCSKQDMNNNLMDSFVVVNSYWVPTTRKSVLRDIIITIFQWNMLIIVYYKRT